MAAGLQPKGEEPPAKRQLVGQLVTASTLVKEAQPITVRVLGLHDPSFAAMLGEYPGFEEWWNIKRTAVPAAARRLGCLSEQSGTSQAYHDGCSPA
ncbi:hypothetical protein WJX73_000047 [Symbiochloris irregularis]|uniref:Uncharacterized protein n=1 Tax=Symbiochloris irregularis TaxID=706552 RepID=A0AAW1PMR3_9CHLO